MLTSADDLHDFLRTRRSIRRFKPDLVADSVIERILATATFAPSAHNLQPWRFVVVTTSVVKAKLADAMAADFRRDLEKENVPENEITVRLDKSRARINSAPVVIVLCMDATGMNVYPDRARKKAEYIMAVQSVANAGAQLLLAAHAEGLGGVWTCGPLFAPGVVKSTLELQKTWEPQAMFFIGYPAETPEARERKPLNKIVKFL